jgi:nicotinamidase-related amidase
VIKAPRRKQRFVLLALHLQNDIIHPSGRLALGLCRMDVERRAVLANSALLMEAARATAVPVIHVRMAFKAGHSDACGNGSLFEQAREVDALVEGSWGADFHDDVKPLSTEMIYTHNRISAFRGTTLLSHLIHHRCNRLVCCGVASNSVVEHSAREAADLGFDVAVASDATGSGRPDLHAAALANIALIGSVASSSDLCAGFGKRSS